MMFPTSFDDVLKLQGTSVWMKNGYTMPYFPYEAGRIVFAKTVGVIPSAQRLDIKKVIKAVAARSGRRRHHRTARRQVFAIFALPGGPSLYATAIGAIDGARKNTSPTSSSSTTIPTPSTTTGPKMSGPPSTRTRSSPA